MTPAQRLRNLSKKQEKGIAADMRGRTTPASGALRDPTAKGDVIARMFRVEAKMTGAASYSLTRAVLDKIETEALRNCQSPLLSLQIKGEQYAVLRWQDFLAIIHDAKYL